MVTRDKTHITVSFNSGRCAKSFASHFVNILILGHPIKENILQQFYESGTSIPLFILEQKDVLFLFRQEKELKRYRGIPPSWHPSIWPGFGLPGFGRRVEARTAQEGTTAATDATAAPPRSSHRAAARPPGPARPRRGLGLPQP